MYDCEGHTSTCIINLPCTGQTIHLGSLSRLPGRRLRRCKSTTGKAHSRAASNCSLFKDQPQASSHYWGRSDVSARLPPTFRPAVPFDLRGESISNHPPSGQAKSTTSYCQNERKGNKLKHLDRARFLLNLAFLCHTTVLCRDSGKRLSVFRRCQNSPDS